MACSQRVFHSTLHIESVKWVPLGMIECGLQMLQLTERLISLGNAYATEVV